MTKKIQAIIRGLGAFVPEKILSNSDLEKIVETSNEWITTRTGISERRIAQTDEFPSTMGIQAAKMALAAGGLPPQELDAIIVSSLTPDYLCPTTASVIQHGLGATKACAFDIQAACSGFLYGLSLAKAYVESGIYRHVLLVAAEKNSSFIDYQDRATCVIFGDGAGAALISQEGAGWSIGHVSLGTDGEWGHLLSIPASGARLPASHETVDKRLHYMKMNGKEIFRHAVRRMEASAKECLEKENLTPSDIRWLIPHQANLRIMESCAKRFDIPWERVYRTIHKYGNTSSSSIPIALCELEKSTPCAPNENIMLAAFGGGLTWGASILKKVVS